MKLGRLNHIGIATPSIADSIAFYRDVMGATTIHEAFDLRFSLVGAVGAGLFQKTIDERGLAVIDVGDNCDVPNVFHKSNF